jgi:hypothetical protein
MIKVVFFDGNGVIYKKKNSDFTKDFFNDLEQKSGYKNIKEIFKLLVHDCQKGVYSKKELLKRVH